MTEPSRPQATGAGVLAAMLPLLSLPVGLIVTAVRLSDDGRIDRTLLVDWEDRPLSLTAVGALAVVVALVCAVSLYLLAQRGSLAPLGIPAACSLLVVLGAVVRAQAPGPTLGSISTGLAHELLPLLGGLWREGAHLLQVARTLAIALLVASALACGLVAAVRPERLARALAPLLALHALVLAALGAREEALAAALNAGIRQIPDRMLAVAVERSSLAPDPAPVLLAAALGLVVTLVAGAAALRSTARVAVLFVLMGLTGLAGPGGQVASGALVKRRLAVALPGPVVPLVQLEGAFAEAPVVVLDPRGVVVPGRDEPLDEAGLRAVVAGVQATRPHLLSRFPIGVRHGGSLHELAALAAMIARTTGTGAVTLVGLHHDDATNAARELRWLFDPLQDAYRGVSLELGDMAGEGWEILDARAFDSLEALIAAARTHHAEGKVVFLSVGR